MKKPVIISWFGWFLFRLLFPSLYHEMVYQENENVYLLYAISSFMDVIE